MANRSRVPLGLLAALVLTAAWLVAPATAVAGDPCYHGFDIPPRTTEATSEVKVAPCAFGPTIARIPVGGTVTFFNGPDFVHLITGANQEWGSRDAELSPNSQVSYTFDKPGIYPYACALHRGMSGAIVVGEAGSADATVPDTSTTSPPAARGSAPDLEVAGLAAGVAGVLLGAGTILILTRSRRRPAGEADTPATP